MTIVYCAYEGDHLLGKFATAEEAEESLKEARRAAGEWAARRIYRVEARQARGGELPATYSDRETP